MPAWRSSRRGCPRLYLCAEPQGCFSLLAGAIIARFPPFVTTVGVFVNEHPETIRDIRHSCGLDLVQFHGDESPGHAALEQMDARAIKAFRMKNRSSPADGTLTAKEPGPLLLDAYVGAGGEGRHREGF